MGSAADTRALALASGSARLYSLHRDFGIEPDAVPAEPARVAAAEADHLPAQFFGPTPNLADPPADTTDNSNRQTTKNATSTSTATKASSLARK